MYTASVPQTTKMLQHLAAWLDKAEAHARQKNYDVNVLLGCRLAPDMFPLVRQIQSACDTAKFMAARLSGKPAPRHADDEKSVEEIRTRIASTLEFLNTIGEKDFQGAAERKVTTSYLPEGKGFTGPVYLNQSALPNFYFHLTTAYLILRHNGIDVGKDDYLGEPPLVDL
jgi:hypothetical protein